MRVTEATEKGRLASRLVEWSILACFPAGIFVLLGVLELPSFADPCHSWAGDADGPQPSATKSPDPSCVGHTSSPETKMQALTRLLLFQGTTLLGLVVGLVGAWRGRRSLVWIGAGILGMICIPLITGLSVLFPLVSALLFGLGPVLFPLPPAPSRPA